jgi:hypothetical protein
MRRWRTVLPEEAGIGEDPHSIEPSTGTEPATPSLPSMRRGFTTPSDTSHLHTTAQVSTAVEGCIVRRNEAARSVVFWQISGNKAR